MRVLIKRFFIILVGIIPTLISFFTFFSIWFFTSKDESIAPYFALGGIAIGLIFTFFAIKRLSSEIYRLPKSFLPFIYIFYSLCLYGFFMGFPAFNIFLGILAGIYFAERERYVNEGNNYEIRSTSVFTTSIMFLFCCASSLLALTQPSIETEIQHMLNLNFALPHDWTIILILMSGILLTALQYVFTGLAYRIDTRGGVASI